MPWQTKAQTEFGEVVLNDKAIMFYIFIGGGLEFIGAQASVISFNGALSAGFNGGICGAIIALNTVFILIAAYFLFNESLNKVKLISICCLVTSVILVSLFTPSYSDVIQAMPSVAGTGVDNTISQALTEKDRQFYESLMVAGGLVASLCFGSQLLVFKTIMKFSKDTFAIGFGFLFSCGLLGLITLGVEFMRSPHDIENLPLSDIVGPIAVGTCTALGIVLANIGAGLGIAGISNSIIHTSLVIVTVFNYFVFNQLLTLEQVIGVLLTMLGGVLVAFDDKISDILNNRGGRLPLWFKGKKKAITSHVNDVPIL